MRFIGAVRQSKENLLVNSGVSSAQTIGGYTIQRVILHIIFQNTNEACEIVLRSTTSTVNEQRNYLIFVDTEHHRAQP